MKSNQYLSSLILCFALMLAACTEEVELDLDDIDPALVVEGLVSDDPDRKPYVKLSRSGSYSGDTPPPPERNALVVISEDDALVDTLIETQPGYYEAQNLLVGKHGSEYKLFVQLEDGSIYEAMGRLKPVADLDSLTVNFREETPFSYEDDGYYVTINFQEPGSTNDFYRLIFYLGESQYDPEELIYASDDLANGQYIRNIEFTEFVVFPGDTVRVEMHSLTEEYYNFLSTLDANQNTGDLFDTPPANIEGNVSNGAFGYFATSAITQETIIIQE